MDNDTTNGPAEERLKKRTMATRVRFRILATTIIILRLSSGVHTFQVDSRLNHFCQDHNDGIFAHPESCSKFVKCGAGVAYVQQCSADLHFNPRINVCDHPISALCQLQEIPQLVMSEEEEDVEDEDSRPILAERDDGEYVLGQSGLKIRELDVMSQDDPSHSDPPPSLDSFFTDGSEELEIEFVPGPPRDNRNVRPWEGKLSGSHKSQYVLQESPKRQTRNPTYHHHGVRRSEPVSLRSSSDNNLHHQRDSNQARHQPNPHHVHHQSNPNTIYHQPHSNGVYHQPNHQTHNHQIHHQLHSNGMYHQSNPNNNVYHRPNSINVHHTPVPNQNNVHNFHNDIQRQRQIQSPVYAKEARYRMRDPMDGRRQTVVLQETIYGITPQGSLKAHIRAYYPKDGTITERSEEIPSSYLGPEAKGTYHNPMQVMHMLKEHSKKVPETEEDQDFEGPPRYSAPEAREAPKTAYKPPNHYNTSSANSFSKPQPYTARKQVPPITNGHNYMAQTVSETYRNEVYPPHIFSSPSGTNAYSPPAPRLVTTSPTPPIPGQTADNKVPVMSSNLQKLQQMQQVHLPPPPPKIRPNVFSQQQRAQSPPVRSHPLPANNVIQGRQNSSPLITRNFFTKDMKFITPALKTGVPFLTTTARPFLSILTPAGINPSQIPSKDPTREMKTNYLKAFRDFRNPTQDIHKLFDRDMSIHEKRARLPLSHPVHRNQNSKPPHYFYKERFPQSRKEPPPHGFADEPVYRQENRPAVSGFPMGIPPPPPPPDGHEYPSPPTAEELQHMLPGPPPGFQGTNTNSRHRPPQSNNGMPPQHRHNRNSYPLNSPPNKDYAHRNNNVYHPKIPDKRHYSHKHRPALHAPHQYERKRENLAAYNTKPHRMEPKPGYKRQNGYKNPQLISHPKGNFPRRQTPAYNKASQHSGNYRENPHQQRNFRNVKNRNHDKSQRGGAGNNRRVPHNKNPRQVTHKHNQRSQPRQPRRSYPQGNQRNGRARQPPSPQQRNFKPPNTYNRRPGYRGPKQQPDGRHLEQEHQKDGGDPGKSEGHSSSGGDPPSFDSFPFGLIPTHLMGPQFDPGKATTQGKHMKNSSASNPPRANQVKAKQVSTQQQIRKKSNNNNDKKQTKLSTKPPLKKSKPFTVSPKNYRRIVTFPTTRNPLSSHVSTLPFMLTTKPPKVSNYKSPLLHRHSIKQRQQQKGNQIKPPKFTHQQAYSSSRPLNNKIYGSTVPKIPRPFPGRPLSISHSQRMAAFGMTPAPIQVPGSLTNKFKPMHVIQPFGTLQRNFSISVPHKAAVKTKGNGNVKSTYSSTHMHHSFSQNQMKSMQSFPHGRPSPANKKHGIVTMRSHGHEKYIIQENKDGKTLNKKEVKTYVRPWRRISKRSVDQLPPGLKTASPKQTDLPRTNTMQYDGIRHVPLGIDPRIKNMKDHLIIDIPPFNVSLNEYYGPSLLKSQNATKLDDSVFTERPGQGFGSFSGFSGGDSGSLGSNFPSGSSSDSNSDDFPALPSEKNGFSTDHMDSMAHDLARPGHYPPLPGNFRPHGPPGSLSRYAHHCMRMAKGNVHRRIRDEAHMVRKLRYVTDSMPFKHVAAFFAAKPYSMYISHAGTYMRDVMKNVGTRYHMAMPKMYRVLDRVARSGLKFLPHPGAPDVPMPMPPDVNVCPYPRDYICNTEDPFRSYDGSCNNLKSPIWGRSLTPFKRLVPAIYGDGIESLRLSVVEAHPLPGPRTISLQMFPDVNRPSTVNTLMLMIWGQFVDHDITRTAITESAADERGFGETEEVKCGFDGCETGQPGLEACWPIPIPGNDPDFKHDHCLKFVRSQGTPPLKCNYGPREQINQVTSWIDASMIYGSTKEEAYQLRDFSDRRRGRMLVTPHPHGRFFKPLLPQDDVSFCRNTNNTIKCFKAGDERVNEQAGLTAMHTIWVREHNRIEQRLYELNPHWNGERLYQESRKIIAAMIQHIIYKEQLPMLMGDQIMKDFDLALADDGYYYGYTPKLDPRVANAFGTAAYRFGHTLIQDRIRRTSYDFEHDDSLMLSMAFRRPLPVYDTARGGVDSLVRGMCGFASQQYDNFITKQVTRSLFTENPPFGPGMDLMSLNIQRGRDHGLGSYNSYREYCGLRRAYNFEDLSAEISNPRTRRFLSQIYAHPDDIDLFVGGISENSIEGAVLGPTFACIIAHQFQVLKKGDRYWYENDKDTGFTIDQLAEIRKVRLSRILCANGDYIDHIQPFVLLRETNKQPFSKESEFYDKLTEKHGLNFNAIGSCDDLIDIDLSKWQQGPYVGK